MIRHFFDLMAYLMVGSAMFLGMITVLTSKHDQFTIWLFIGSAMISFGYVVIRFVYLREKAEPIVNIKETQ